MKKRWIALGVVAAIAVAGGVLRFAFPGQAVAWAAKQGIPGMIGEWRNPIAPNRAIVWQAGPSTAPTGERPPNIVLIVADDLGMNDISLYGGGLAGGLVPTPNIDALAREGVDFTTGYAGNATCSPSRAAMMTGRYPTRFGFEFTGIPPSFAATVGHADSSGPHPVIFRDDLNVDVIPSQRMGVPSAEITIAEALKTRGYRTLHLGKWHLGEADDLGPHAQGFDESLGMRAGGGMFLPEDHPDTVNAKLPFDPIEGVTFIQGDFREEAVAQDLVDALAGRPVDVVVSDMAPNLSGIETTDAARVTHLIELAVDFCIHHLKPDGALVCKTFHGSGYNEQVKLFKNTFRVFKPIKPKASRDKSSETFLVGMGLRSR